VEELAINDRPPDPIQAEADETISQIGRGIRNLRQHRRLTIQQIADAAGISASMLSLLERGLTSPSLLTLTAITRALGTTLAELLSGESPTTDEAVTRFVDVPVIETDRILRKVLRQDRKHGVTITYNDYPPNAGNSKVGITHQGFEYGLVLEGELTIEIDGVPSVLGSGDLVSLRSTRLHKIWNYGRKRATAIWFNLDEPGE
jgi:transcriptional regulator with XRE-family HTH domain